MKEIPLTKGFVALVDDEDYDWLMWWKWCYHSGGYARCMGKDKPYRASFFMHRLILNAQPGIQVDHINGDKLDNCRCNLRLVNSLQNNWNRAPNKGNHSSRFRGVSWDKQNQKWLTSFHSEIDAAKAWNEAASKYYGEFARLNEIKESE